VGELSPTVFIYLGIDQRSQQSRDFREASPQEIPGGRSNL